MDAADPVGRVEAASPSLATGDRPVAGLRLLQVSMHNCGSNAIAPVISGLNKTKDVARVIPARVILVGASERPFGWIRRPG